MLRAEFNMTCDAFFPSVSARRARCVFAEVNRRARISHRYARTPRCRAALCSGSSKHGRNRSCGAFFRKAPAERGAILQKSIAEPAFLTDARELPVVSRPGAVAPPNMVAASHAGVRWSCLRLGHDVLLALGDERFELPHAFPTEMQQRVKVFRREISKPLRHASLKRQGATVLRMRRCCGVFTDGR